MEAGYVMAFRIFDQRPGQLGVNYKFDWGAIVAPP